MSYIEHEFSCDKAVLEKTGDGKVQDYGKNLLDVIVEAGKYKESFGTVALSENKKLWC